MPALGEYLGALLAEITNARVQADLESARIAQLYASHPLLQHMAVPRFRLPNVSLDLPVAVEKIEQPPPTTPHPAELPALRRNIEGIIDQELRQLKLQLPPNLRKRLTDSLNRLFDRLKASGSISASDAIKASDDAVTAAVEAIKAAGKEHATVDPALESSLRRQFAAEFLKLQPPPPRVQVLVVTAQLKDIAPPLSLTRIHLTISEEGVEWTQTNPSDPSSKTLLPE
jgi:hypothetical protein